MVKQKDRTVYVWSKKELGDKGGVGGVKSGGGGSRAGGGAWGGGSALHH